MMLTESTDFGIRPSGGGFHGKRSCGFWWRDEGMFESLPLTTQISVAKMRTETKKAAQCGRLMKSRTVEVVAHLGPYGFSSLADCLHRLTIDVDGTQFIGPSRFTEPVFAGLCPQSLHTVPPVCAVLSSHSTGRARCKRRRKNHSSDVDRQRTSNASRGLPLRPRIPRSSHAEGCRVHRPTACYCTV